MFGLHIVYTYNIYKLILYVLKSKTQNIDGLEAVAGVNPEKLVECHGHFRAASCINCGTSHEAEDVKASMLDKGEAPLCSKCGSLVKPDIVSRCPCSSFYTCNILTSYTHIFWI